MRRLLLTLPLLMTISAQAADNTVLLTPCSSGCVTMRSKDVGAGVESPINILGDTSGNAIYGTAGSANANVLTIQGIASMTKLLVTPDSVALPANQSVNVAQINGVTPLMGNGVTGTGSPRVTIASDNTAFAVNSTLSAETTKVIGTTRTLGNIGAVVDFAGQAATAPANSWLVGATFFTTPTTLTNGQASPLQMDNAGNLLVNIKTGASSGAVAQGSTTSGQTGLLVQGAVTTAAPSYTTAQTSPLSLDTAGNLRVNVTTALGLAQGSTTSGQTGSMIMGAVTTANPSYTTAQTAYASLDTSGNLRVVNAPSRYQAVAASQTATVLQSSTGATGDYLSHCDIYPATTSPGVVTVFDNTNTAANSAILFAGGASSVSNLAPIPVPVGALSRNGAWEVTTGANVSVVCFGKFS